MTQNNKNGGKATSDRANFFKAAQPSHFLPDPRLARLLSLFGGTPYGWIHAENTTQSHPDAKPDYTTVSTHPIEPRVLADLYFDPAVLVGLRFDTRTRWAGFDIDAGSILNPLVPADGVSQQAAAENFGQLLEIAERYGLIAPSFYRSGSKGGLWIKWAFDKQLRTIEVAALLRKIAFEAGFLLVSGQLEAFPNLKPFQNTADRRKFTAFKAYRLPMQPQTGAVLLNDDLEPIADSADALIDQLEFTASRIDTAGVERACALAYADHKRRLEMRWKSRSSAREEWIAELERITAIGFTAHGQTNDLLGKIACLGVVRDGLKGLQLARFIEETVTSLPGYRLYCRHQHEISQRSRQWAASAEAFYWHVDDPERERSGSYMDMFTCAGTGTRENRAEKYHQQRSNAVLEQLTAALEGLQGNPPLPTLTAVFQAACEKARELFGKAFSKRTWQKYKEQLSELIASLIQSPVTAPMHPLPAGAETVPESLETQAQSQSTPCLQESPETRPAESPEIQAQSQSTPCLPIMKVFEPVTPAPFQPKVIAPFHAQPLWRFMEHFVSSLLLGSLPHLATDGVRFIGKSYDSQIAASAENLISPLYQSDGGKPLYPFKPRLIPLVRRGSDIPLEPTLPGHRHAQWTSRIALGQPPEAARSVLDGMSMAIECLGSNKGGVPGRAVPASRSLKAILGCVLLELRRRCYGCFMTEEDFRQQLQYAQRGCVYLQSWVNQQPDRSLETDTLIGLVWLSASVATRIASDQATPLLLNEVCDMLRSMTMTNLVEAANLMKNPQA